MKNEVSALGPSECRHPALLVSVRDLAEAGEALAGGCDILDLKEPRRGSLGMVDVTEMARVVDSLRESSLLAERADHSPEAASVAGVKRAVTLSAALGEAVDWRDGDVPALPAGLTFAKLGLAGLGNGRAGIELWRDVRTRFAERAASAVGWIAVVYADWQAAEAPPPEAILAATDRCAGVLFDTFHKGRGTLFDWLPEAELRRLIAPLRARRMAVALAGSLRREQLPAAARLVPDIVAIRSAACAGGNRQAAVCRQAVRNFGLELRRCSS